MDDKMFSKDYGFKEMVSKFIESDYNTFWCKV